jgi:hypothetical protein
MQRCIFWYSRESILKVALLATLAAGFACSHPQPQSATPQQLLFVTLPEKRSVAIFAAGASGDEKPLLTIQEAPPDTPFDAGTSLAGEVFVGNSNGTVNVYTVHQNDYRFARKFAGPNTEMVHPVSMAVDPGGTVYIADRGADPGTAKVMWMVPGLRGNIAPEKILTGPHTGLTSPTGIAIDASEDVYVADHDSGKILIFDSSAQDDAPPVATIDGLKGPGRVFVDQDLNMYISCDGDSSIVVMAPDGPRMWSRTATITSAAMRMPVGVTADSSGRIATAVNGAVLFFAAEANGPSTPLLELQGPEPMNPTGLLIR